MIDQGVEAPEFELPAVVEGEVESVALEEFLGSNVVVLAFYPGDFNPACGDGTTDLDELDLFTMQRDVTILAVSGDSVHSHRAFADEYDLHIPLLADTHGQVATDYDVAVEEPTAGYRTHRAVFVVSPAGDVEYAWETDDLTELPPVDAIREAVDDVGGTETAMARYRVGHAHYVEGRRAFTSAMGGFQNEEWMVAQSDFRRAFEEFEEASNQFNSAGRFSDDEHEAGYYGIAEDKAELLWQAAEWLAKAANAYASGEGAEGQALRDDAERTLEDARDLFEPPEPEEFPPEADPSTLLEEESADESILPDDEAGDVDTALEVDIDDAAAHADDEVTDEVDAQDVPANADDGGVDGDDGDGDQQEEAEEGEEGEEIDDAELDEITAELEQQTEAARREREAEEADASETEGDVDEGDSSAAEGVDASADSEPGEAETDDVSDEGEGDEAAEDMELELTDPTGGEGLDPLEEEDEAADGDEETEEGEDEGDEEDLGGGDHGVPDSL